MKLAWNFLPHEKGTALKIGAGIAKTKIPYRTRIIPTIIFLIWKSIIIIAALINS